MPIRHRRCMSIKYLILFALMLLGACSPLALPQCETSYAVALSEHTEFGLYVGLRKPGSHPKVDILEFLATSTGNAAPLRVTHLTAMLSSGPYGVDASGNFWSGFTKYNDKGVALGSLNLLRPGWIVGPATVDFAENFYAVEGPGSFTSRRCPYFGNVFVDEYRPGVYGNPTPVRSVNVGNEACYYGGIAVDSLGRLYVAEDPGRRGDARIVVFPAQGSGRLKPTRVLIIPRFGPSPPQIENLHVDSSGNVFALYLDAGSRDPHRVLMYSPNANLPQRLLAGVRVGAFTISAENEIEALIQVRTKPSIQTYKIGRADPIAILAGPRTGLSRRGWIIIGIAAPQSPLGCSATVIQ